MDSFNHALCTTCQGACCKNMPGATSPEDWGAPDVDVMQMHIGKALQSGEFVLAALPERPHEPYLMPLRTTTGCIFLRKDGCRLPDTKRPEGCRALIPSEDFPSSCHYPKGVSINHFIDRWRPYRNLLDAASEPPRIRKRRSIWSFVR